ncbi:sensor histidine kinase [Aquibacillus saliphilus]|uniref:sensor histidine kinase n=1 Tax=Aquibacillus saliphilus TaxID=1909422 RepID=UPI001CF005D0|nr:HAMP domain-containing sensor histidine kinase [Aquibacillus saliphilus]
MIYVALTLFFLTLLLLTREFVLKKEVKKISKQLQLYNKSKTNKKIDMSLLDKDIENLGIEINKLMDLYVTENRKRVRFKNEQKQAVANMSHDLRTPLTSILGFIQMAEDDDITTDERKELLATAIKRAKRLEEMLKEFFELSIIESTDRPMKSEQINMRNLTINILMSFYDRFNDKNIEPIIQVPENDVFIVSDESAVTRVIENLFSNAIAHSNGNLIISLEENDRRARLIVKNDALSLTEEDVDRIFDRFYMADQSRSGKSTGLGLSIVKSFMEKMDGTITGQLNDEQLSIICEWETVKNK